MGRAKQRVLPVPVGEPPIRSDPDKIVGIVSDWIGVGTVMAKWFKDRSKGGERCNEVKDLWDGCLEAAFAELLEPEGPATDDEEASIIILGIASSCH